jgi:hypothetical protein
MLYFASTYFRTCKRCRLETTWLATEKCSKEEHCLCRSPCEKEQGHTIVLLERGCGADLTLVWLIEVWTAVDIRCILP